MVKSLCNARELDYTVPYFCVVLANCLICYQTQYATSRAMTTRSKNSCCM